MLWSPKKPLKEFSEGSLKAYLTGALTESLKASAKKLLKEPLYESFREPSKALRGLKLPDPRASVRRIFRGVFGA